MPRSRCAIPSNPTTQHDRPERHQQLHRLVELAPLVGEDRRRDRDQPELGELRGLDRDRPEVDPARRAVEGGAGGGSRRRSPSGPSRRPSTQIPSVLPDARRQPRDDDRGADPDRRVEHLALEVPEAVPAVALRGRDRAGRQHHDEPDHRQAPADPPSRARSRRASRFASAGLRRRGGGTSRRRRARRAAPVRRRGAVLAGAWPSPPRRALPGALSHGRPHPVQRARARPRRTGRRARRRRRTDPSSRSRARAARRRAASPAANAAPTASSIEPASCTGHDARRTRRAIAAARLADRDHGAQVAGAGRRSGDEVLSLRPAAGDQHGVVAPPRSPPAPRGRSSPSSCRGTARRRPRRRPRRGARRARTPRARRARPRARRRRRARPPRRRRRPRGARRARRRPTRARPRRGADAGEQRVALVARPRRLAGRRAGAEPADARTAPPRETAAAAGSSRLPTWTSSSRLVAGRSRAFASR